MISHEPPNRPRLSGHHHWNSTAIDNYEPKFLGFRIQYRQNISKTNTKSIAGWIHHSPISLNQSPNRYHVLRKNSKCKSMFEIPNWWAKNSPTTNPPSPCFVEISGKPLVLLDPIAMHFLLYWNAFLVPCKLESGFLIEG